MNNNILRDIQPNLIKKGDAFYSSFDILIQQNKIFGLLFISGIVPKIKNIIELFNKIFDSVTQKDDILKLIICICDEEKNEYENTFSKFSNLSCFIIPFESDIKQKLINKYNIISLPCLIIFDKNGKSLEFLNNSDIINDVNIDKIKGWKNTFNLINNFKMKKYQIGDEGYVYDHQHILRYVDYLGKSPNYGKGNWYCDICGKTHKYDVTNFYCDLCGFDVCEDCYEKNKK
jgi:hypothetical protein